MTEIQRKVNAYAFPCSVSSVKKVPKFRSTTTLQLCKLIYAIGGGKLLAVLPRKVISSQTITSSNESTSRS